MKPWVQGPLELLKHGLEHSEVDTDFDRRMALICIDNSIELMIKTYLSLPQRVTGFHLSRDKYFEAAKYFGSLLQQLEEKAPTKLVGIELEDIEWLHNSRNELYHQGNGVTIEARLVDMYGSIATILICNLFDLTEQDIRIPHSDIGEFFQLWGILDQQLVTLGEKHGVGFGVTSRIVPSQVLGYLRQNQLIPEEDLKFLDTVRNVRNATAHGGPAPKNKELDKYVFRLKHEIDIIKSI